MKTAKELGYEEILLETNGTVASLLVAEDLAEAGVTDVPWAMPSLEAKR